MDDKGKAVEKYIETGEYFSEAIRWYNKIFIYPLRDFVIMQILCYATVIMFVVMLLNIYRIFPLKEDIRIITKMGDTINFFPKIVLSDGSKTARQFVSEALVAKYLISRESYDSKRFGRDYAFISRSSEEEIFDEYYGYINSKDPNSPASLSSNKHIKKVRLINKSSTDVNKVTITFYKNIFDTYGGLQSSSKWKADIEFYLSNYDFSKVTNSELDFIITKYKVSKIKEDEETKKDEKNKEE